MLTDGQIADIRERFRRDTSPADNFDQSVVVRLSLSQIAVICFAIEVLNRERTPSPILPAARTISERFARQMKKQGKAGVALFIRALSQTEFLENLL